VKTCEALSPRAGALPRSFSSAGGPGLAPASSRRGREGLEVGEGDGPFSLPTGSPGVSPEGLAVWPLDLDAYPHWRPRRSGRMANPTLFSRTHHGGQPEWRARGSVVFPKERSKSVSGEAILALADPGLPGGYPSGRRISVAFGFPPATKTSCTRRRWDRQRLFFEEVLFSARPTEPGRNTG